MYKTITFYITDSTPPSQPTGLAISANSSGNHVKLTWLANSENDLGSYEISRQVNEGS